MDKARFYREMAYLRDRLAREDEKRFSAKDNDSRHAALSHNATLIKVRRMLPFLAAFRHSRCLSVAPLSNRSDARHPQSVMQHHMRGGTVDGMDEMRLKHLRYRPCAPPVRALERVCSLTGSPDGPNGSDEFHRVVELHALRFAIGSQAPHFWWGGSAVGALGMDARSMDARLHRLVAAWFAWLLFMRFLPGAPKRGPEGSRCGGMRNKDPDAV